MLMGVNCLEIEMKLCFFLVPSSLFTDKLSLHWQHIDHFFQSSHGFLGGWHIKASNCFFLWQKMKSTLLGLCANDTFCLVSRGGACCCGQFLRNVSDYCLAGGIFEVGMQSYLLETAGCILLTCPTSNTRIMVYKGLV